MVSHLNLIEFVGPVGAGKTSLSQRLAEHLTGKGFEVLTLRQAIEQCADRTRMGRLRMAVIGKPPVRRGTRQTRILAVLGFAALHSRLILTVLRSQVGLPLTVRHRFIILRLFFDVAAGSQLAARHLSDREIVILDEGLIHRAVNLYSWGTGQFPQRALRVYLDRLPSPGLVVLVDAPADMVALRLGVSGYPKRLRSADRETRQRFINRSNTVIENVRANLETNGHHTVVVFNDDSLDATAIYLASQVEHEMELDRPARGLHAPLDVNLHMRVRRRIRTNDTTDTTAKPWDEVLQRFGRTRTGEAVAAVGAGRSSAVIVPTLGGKVFVKRYKDSLETSVIHAEHQVLHHLDTLGFSAPRLIKQADGTTLEANEQGRYAMFEYIDNSFTYTDYLWSPRQKDAFVRHSGQTLAAVHRSTQSYPFSFHSRDGFEPDLQTRYRDTKWAADVMARLVERAPARWIPASNEAAAERLGALEAQINAAMPTIGTIHGDYGPYNLLFRRGVPPVVTDFELTRTDWLIADIAKALGQFGVDRRGFRIHRMRTFVSAYARMTDISFDHLEQLPAVWEYLTLRRAVALWQRFLETDSEQHLTRAHQKHAFASSIRRESHALRNLQTT